MGVGAFPQGAAALGLGTRLLKVAVIPVPWVRAGLARGCPDGCEQSPWAALALAEFAQCRPVGLLISSWGDIAGAPGLGAGQLPLCWGVETWEEQRS